MLSAKVTYKGKRKVEDILKGVNVKQKEHAYALLSAAQEELAAIQFDEAGHSLSIAFPGHLTLKQYEQIHHAIIQIQSAVEGEVEDSKALLGYLKNGEAACIVTNWDEWVLFLNGAKHTSMEGKKVRVVNDRGEEAASGLLVDYKTDPARPEEFIIVECTVITATGEQTVSGKRLHIEPTNEW